MKISMFCDRYNTCVSKSQAGFIKNIALPLYEALNSYLVSETLNKYCIAQLKINKREWEISSYERKPKSHSEEILSQIIRDNSLKR